MADLIEVAKSLPTMSNERLMYLIENENERIKMCLTFHSELKSTATIRNNYLRDLNTLILTEASKRWKASLKQFA
jgi:hypothetical protein